MAEAARETVEPFAALRRRWPRLALCAALGCVLYLPFLGGPGLWEPDEGRYAEIAREMVVSGDWITPRNDFVRYFEKPPLMYWITAALLEVMGKNELTVRLPAAIFSIGELLITYALAENMFGETSGLLAAVCLALSPLFVGFARFLTLDPALSFFVSAALGSFYMALAAYDAGRGGAFRGWMYLAAAMTALGTLTKGPVALVVGGGVGMAFILWERRLELLRRMPWIGCALTYLVIVGPWFGLVARRNPGFLKFFFLHEHVQRYLVSNEHAWGPYFFIPVVIVGMWPWIWFVPGEIGHPSRDGLAAQLDFLLIWFGFVFIFFSIPQSKLGSYILPALPPLAILSGHSLCRLLRTPSPRRTLGGFLLANAAAAAIAVAVAIIIGPRYGRVLGFDLVLVAVLSTGGAALAFVLSKDRRRIPAAVAAMLVAGALAGGVTVKACNDANALSSYRGLAEQISARLQRGCILASYRHFVQSLPFYTGHREALVSYRGELALGSGSPEAGPSFIDSDARLSELWASGNCVLLVANERDREALSATLTPNPRIIGREGKKVAVSNYPPGQEGRAPGGRGAQRP